MTRLTPMFGLALCFLGGVALIAGALALPESQTADVGPGRLPLLVGIAMAILSGVAALQKWREGLASDETAGAAMAAILLALLVLYCILMPLIGAIASTVIFMMAVMLWLDGPSKWLRAFLITAGFCASTYALFTWVIATPLP